MIFQTGRLVLWAATEAESVENVVPAWVKLLLTAGAFLIPYGLGVLIARQLKLKEYALKISIVLFAATLGLMPFAYQILLSQFEDQQFANRLEAYNEWEKNRTITDEDIQEIVEQYPKLRISGTEADDEPPKITAPGD